MYIQLHIIVHVLQYPLLHTYYCAIVGIDEAGGDSSCHSVERQLSTSENRLKKMNQMLKVHCIVE